VLAQGALWALENITLCKVAEEPCKAETHYPAETTIEGKSVGQLTFTGGLGTLKCTSTFKGKTAAGAGGTGGKTAVAVTGVITSLVLSSCSVTTGFGTHECTITPTGLPYTSHMERTGPTTGRLSFTKFSWNMSCPSALIDCTVSAEAITFEVQSTNHPAGRVGPAQLIAKEQNLSSTTGFCNNLKLNGTYELIAPKPLYIETSA
jgi:hypothetical protein